MLRSLLSRLPPARLIQICAALVCALAAVLLLRLFAAEVLRLVGALALPLDDSFIYLQYARRLAEGHFFSYSGQDGYTPGATSPIYPVLLAPAFLLGGAGERGVQYALWLGCLLLAGLGWATFRLGQRIGGLLAGVLAAALTLGMGGVAFSAFAGMEAPLYSLAVLLVTERVLAHRDRQRTIPGFGLIAAGALLGIARPEGTLLLGMVVVLLGAAALRRGLAGAVVASRGSSAVQPPPAAAPLAVPLGVGQGSARPVRAFFGRLALMFAPALLNALINLALVGHAVTNTALAKAYPYDPTLDFGSIAPKIAANAWGLARLLAGDFRFPSDGPLPLAPYLVSIAVLGTLVATVAAARRRPRALSPLLIVLAFMVAGLATTLSSDHYATQGRRYLTPFFPLLAVLVATSVVGLGKVLLASPRPAWLPRWLRAGVAALLLLLLAWPVGRACRDHVRRYAQYFARCCRDIHNQQVKLGRTIREQLPAGAVVGIYDAGAMAYFGERAIYDLAGLCTNDNARPWRDGEGATFERIERTPATRRPTHFAVYRGFFRAPGWFGRLLATTHLDEVTIAGGEDCDLTQAPADFFDSGASPERPPPGNQLRDEIDVADLESEDAHGFASQPGPATRRPGWRGLSQLAVHAASSGSTAPTGLAESSVPAAAVPRHQIADGGRPLTGWQRMRLVVDAGRDATLVVRLGSATGGKLVLFLDDVEVERVNLPPKAARFEERMLLLPASRFGGRGQHNLEARWLSGEVSVYHYWVYQRAE